MDPITEGGGGGETRAVAGVGLWIWDRHSVAEEDLDSGV